MKAYSAQRKKAVVPKRGKISTRSHRRTRVSSRNKSGLYKAVIAGLVFTFSVGFLAIYSINRYLNQTFASAYSSSETSKDTFLDEITAVSYIVVDDIKADPINVTSVNFYIFDKDSKKITNYVVPLNLKLDAGESFGEEEFSKIFALGQMNAKEPVMGGLSAVNKSLFKLFGLKPSRYILVSVNESDFLESFFNGSSYLKLLGISEITQLKNSLVTNLTLREFYKLIDFRKSLPDDRMSKVAPTADFYKDLTQIDDVIKDMTYDSPVAQEKKNIAVLNGTGKAGIALFGSRLVSNLGGRVVAINNTQTTYDKSVVITDDLESETAHVLANIFGISEIISKESARNFSENEIFRSDITIIIGFDILNNLY